MALALNHQPQTRQHVRPVRHLHLVPELDPTPVRVVRRQRPAARQNRQQPADVGRPTAATFQVRRLLVLIVAMMLMGAVIAGLIGITGTSAQAGPAIPGQSVAPRSVIAQPGDTLWAIARRVAPKGNISDLVDQLVAMNGDTISAGQLIHIP